MKKILAILVVVVGFIHAATIVDINTNRGQSIPLMSQEVKGEVNLDTSETDTSAKWLSVFDRTIRTYTDTIGTAWMRCDDSAGTDSVGGRLIWQGNPSVNGTALWEAMDSISIAVASGVETQTKKVVVNSNRYALIRFILRNQLAPGGSAAEKTVCRNVVLNIPKIAVIPGN